MHDLSRGIGREARKSKRKKERICPCESQQGRKNGKREYANTPICHFVLPI